MNTSPSNRTDSGGICPTHATKLGHALTIGGDRIATVDLHEALDFQREFQAERSLSAAAVQARQEEVRNAINNAGGYSLTEDELTYAARAAWRNSIRCIGRLPWRTLRVRDMRHVSTPEEMYQALVDHLSMATNRGAIIPTISVFSRDGVEAGREVKILNRQLIRYAGYKIAAGEIVGDPANADFTELALFHGWKPPHQRSRFDLLPLLIQDHDGRASLFELPRTPEIVLETNLTHPDFAWFPELGLKWHAVPAISNMVLDAGGLKFPTTVFNGWYMGTEIGSRNLGDVQRYNVLPEIAERMGLSRSNRTLWRDRALVELNVAVLHSFEKAGIRIVDHHTASAQFDEFERRERQEGRVVCGDWSWLVPPLAGSASTLFHRSFVEDVVKPGLFYKAE